MIHLVPWSLNCLLPHVPVNCVIDDYHLNGVILFAEEAREVKDRSKTSTVSRERLHGSKAGTMPRCTL